MNKRTFYFASAILLLVIVYFLGPHPETPVYNNTLNEPPVSISGIEDYVNQKEAKLDLKKDNNAEIVWADSIGKPTEYVILYLPGFSATRMEGNPVHLDVASYFGCNLFLSRLAFHGYKTNEFANFTAEGIWESAKEQLALAEKLGQKVIVMSTSTGGTLGLMLAAKFPDRVHSLICLSPNIRMRNPAAFLMNDPWGLQITKLVFGGDNRRIHHKQEEAKLYWDTLYPATAVVQLEELVETAMVDSTFEQVNCPTLALYYYKDEENQDQVVDVSYIPKMFDALGTAPDQKRIKALSTPGDHVIGSSIKSKDYMTVEKEVISFCEEVLGMKAKQH